MKKYLLLFLMCVYASIGAWADVTYKENRAYGSGLSGGYTYHHEAVTIVASSAGEIANDDDLATQLQWYKYIYIAGPINASDVSAINSASTSSHVYIDYSYATGISADGITVSSNFEGLGLPAGSTVPSSHATLH